jgi:hypothetical protein
MAHSGYAKLNLSFPFNTSEKMTNFAFDKKAFRDSTKMDLMLLEMVERSQQIKIEKLLNKHANSMANDNSFVIRIIVILSSNRNRLWTAPVASGKGE